MTKFVKYALTFASVVALSAGAANVAKAADGTGNASAEITVPINITEATALDFGTIERDPAGDTITLDTSDTPSAANSSVLSGSPASGAFNVTGTPNGAVTISFSTGNTLTGPGAAMALGGLNHDAGGTPAFDGSGNLSFNVGAALTVNPAQVGGSYAGTYTVTVNNN